MTKRTQLCVFMILIFLISACNTRLTRVDPVPRRTYASLGKISAITSSMIEFVGSAVIAEIIIRNTIEKRDSVGEVCDAVALVEPGIEEALQQRMSGEIVGEEATIAALQTFLEEIARIKSRLSCETLSLGDEEQR